MFGDFNTCLVHWLPMVVHMYMYIHVLVSVCAVLNVRGVLAAQEPGQALGLDDCQHKMTMPLYLW